MPDAEDIARQICKTAIISSTSVPTEPVRPPLPPGLSWLVDRQGSLRIRNDATATLLPLTGLVVVVGPDAEAYLREVTTAREIQTPKKAAEVRWAEHLRDLEREREGLHKAVSRLLVGMTSSVRLDVPSILPDSQLDEYCQGIRDHGWTVSIDRSPCGSQRRMVIASPAVGDEGAEDPILEVGTRSLRQDIAMVLRAESHGALPPVLIARLTEQLALMLDARGRAASAESQLETLMPLAAWPEAESRLGSAPEQG